jgi:flagellar biosynthetic protein FliO
MEIFREKGIVFLMATAVIFGGICAQAEEPTPKQDEKTLTDKTTQTERNKSFLDDLDLDDNKNPGVREAAIKMTLAVVMVAVLGGAAIYLSRKILPRLSNMSGKSIKVVETVHLGPRKSVHLLKIGNQQILVGSTNENITKLADIPDLTTDQIHDS